MHTGPHESIEGESHDLLPAELPGLLMGSYLKSMVKSGGNVLSVGLRLKLVEVGGNDQ